MGTTVAGGDEYLEPILIDLRCLAILYGALLCVVIISAPIGVRRSSKGVQTQVRGIVTPV